MIPRSPEIKYEPIGRCIYCGKENVPLTDEHIIPLALHGEHLLPKATCIACQTIIKGLRITSCGGCSGLTGLS